MKTMPTAAVLAAGLILLLVVSSFAVAAKGTGSGTVSTDTTRMVKIVYYDTGGKPHTIELNQTSPGPLYQVPDESDVVVQATGFFKGSGGFGLVEIWDEDGWDNFVTKFIPSGKTVTATMPYALYIVSGEHYNLAACVSGPDWNGSKTYYFQIECP